MQDFRKLKVWQKAHQLTLAVYRATQGFPHEERYVLTSQIRRSAASIAANIAEACGRSGSGDFARFLEIALGRQVNWNTISCWLAISTTLTAPRINASVPT